MRVCVLAAVWEKKKKKLVQKKKTERESAAAAAELAIKSLPPPLFSPSWKPGN